MADNGGRRRREWEDLFARYAQEYSEQANQLNRMQRRTLPDGWDADLPESNKSRLTFDGAGDFSAEDRAGRNLHFGSASTPLPRSVLCRSFPPLASTGSRRVRGCRGGSG